MPKSKRDKKISLTKTDKKGLALKQKIVEDVRSCVEKFNSVYVFTFVNMRNRTMKDVREEWKPSRFFFGKNKVISVGLGRTSEEEVQDDLHKLAKCLKGQCGLLFTDCKKEEVVDWFKDYSYQDYARSGFKVDQRIVLEAGPMKGFAHSIEPYLRQLGLPTKLDKGVVTLIKEYEVCKEDAMLTPEQAKILELLEKKMANFKLTLKACWIKGTGFERLSSGNESDDDDDNKEENEEMEAEEGE